MAKRVKTKRDDRKPRFQQMKKKFCRFCADPSYEIDYKDPQVLKYFLTEGGKITPRRISGNCSKHQRRLSLAVKQARMVAILPFTIKGN
ncbi:30S ribosomal protein S18 [bacterium]|nr:30S ribosomal protein S18 [bacterium]